MRSLLSVSVNIAMFCVKIFTKNEEIIDCIVYNTIAHNYKHFIFINILNILSSKSINYHNPYIIEMLTD